MARKRKEWLQFGTGKSYAHRVHRPLQCLVFITPLLLFYQIASFVMPLEPGGAGWHVVAFVLMRQFFALFGAVGNVLPLLAVVAILLCWHLARHDPWDFDPPLYAGMAAESIIWGVPFVVIGMALWRHMPGPAVGVLSFSGGSGVVGDGMPWQSGVVLSVGAGVYEELMFRLIGINLLSMLFMDACEMKPAVGVPLIMVTSAVMFSLYHYLGTESFTMATFGYRTALGIYLAGIYIYRGFGIAVGAHTVYDLILVVFALKH